MLDRTALRLAYRPLEEEVVGERLKQARLAAGQQGEASAIARTLVKAVRGHKAAGLDAFLQAYWPHVRWEDAAQLEPRVAALLPGLTLARVDGKSPVEYLDEPTREAVRRASTALLQDLTPSLATLAARWARHFSFSA